MGAAPQIGSILSEQRACVGIRANVYFRHWDLTPAKRGSFDIVGLCMNQRIDYCSKNQHAVSIENTSTTEQIAPSGMSGIHKRDPIPNILLKHKIKDARHLLSCSLCKNGCLPVLLLLLRV